MIFCDAGEAKELSEMAWDIWTEYYNTFITGDDIEYILRTFQSEEAVRQQILEGYLYSYITEGDVKVGYICFKLESDSIFLSKYYISKDFRGRGLGSKALDEMLEIGRELNMRRVHLRVNRHNHLSINVYKHKGFLITKEEKVDIGNGYFLDDYLMEYFF